MHRVCVLTLLIHLVLACNVEDPSTQNGGLLCLLKWIQRAKGDLEEEKLTMRENRDESENNIKRDDKLNRNFLRFGRSQTEIDDELQDQIRNRKLTSFRSARLIRELGMKRGSLESNFLRFGRSLTGRSNINKRDDKRNKLENNFLRFGRRNDDSHQGYKKSDLDRNFLRFGRMETTSTSYRK